MRRLALAAALALVAGTTGCLEEGSTSTVRIIEKGIQISASSTRSVPTNPGGPIPTTVNDSPLMWIELPTRLGSDPKRRRHAA